MPGFMRLAIRTLILATLLLCLAAPAAQAFEIGLQDDGVFLINEFDRELAFQQAEKLGVSYIRVDMVWASYRKSGFAPFDSLVDAAAAHGLKVQMTLTGNPSYLRGNRRLTYYKPNASRYAIFVRKVAQHFKGRVFRYSIWNEPNIRQFLAPVKQAPRLYRRLYLAGYRALKGVDRRNKVFIGELAAIPTVFAFMDKIGQGLKADGLAYHPYQFFKAPGRPDKRFVGISNTPRIKREVRRLARLRVVRTPAGGVPPIYFTEFSYPIGRPYPTSELHRKRWIPSAFKLAKRAGIRQMVYYKLFQRRLGSNWNSGILTRGGRPTPSFKSLRAIRAQLIGH